MRFHPFASFLPLIATFGALTFGLFCCACTGPQLNVVTNAAGRGTKPLRPLTVKSNESNQKQLKLAQEQGQAVKAALDWEVHQPGALCGEMRAGEYRIAYTLTPAEGWYVWQGGQLQWREPSNGNAHFRAIILDGGDGRFVPGLMVKATVMDSSGHVLEQKPLPFGWYPLLNGYGDNFTLPAPDMYQIRIEIDPPSYWRHDPYNGYRFTQKVTATFEHISASPAVLRNQLFMTTAEEGQLTLAKRQGSALADTLKGMWAQANSGSEKPAGDYQVAYAVEYSEAYWLPRNGHFTYHTQAENSAATNCHVEVAPLDERTGRFLPDLQVSASVATAEGKSIGTWDEPFMWHPWLYHYGQNWRIPQSRKDYRLQARFDPPAWRRYGRATGNRFREPVSVEFSNVIMKEGEK